MSQKSNKNFAFALISLCFSMVLLSFASVPIYNLFCKVTGYGGMPSTTTKNISSNKGTKQITIEFDANIDSNLPWRFVPKQRRVLLTPGQNTLVFYESENFSKKDIIGTAIYNVTPYKAGKYFVKIHCFCFEEQLLKAGEKALMPVTFLIDPSFEQDPEMGDVKTITLSYSFFKVREVSNDKPH